MLIINTFQALGFTTAQSIYLSEGWTSAVFHPVYSQE
jgi:hypothetical protein